jgi:hypothetical protein
LGSRSCNAERDPGSTILLTGPRPPGPSCDETPGSMLKGPVQQLPFG